MEIHPKINVIDQTTRPTLRISRHSLSRPYFLTNQINQTNFLPLALAPYA
jgi:hypothetical protein